MADLLGITNATPNYDSTNPNRTSNAAIQPQNPKIQNAPDPSRITRADGRTEQQGAENANTNALRYDSNFQTFLQQLRQSPEMAEVLAKTLIWMKGTISMPGLDKGIAEEMAMFLEMVKMDEKQFKTFFLQQMKSGNRFAGPLFSLLRQAYQNMGNEHLQEAIATFAKKYADFSSTEHIATSMKNQLKQMLDYLPRSWRGQLEELIGQLEQGLQSGTRAENLKLLQGKIIPYLRGYVERTHDLGTVRDLIRMFMLNVTRYENGSQEGVLAAFHQLTGYGDLLAGLNQLDDRALLHLLSQNSFTEAAKENQFADRLAQTALQAMQGKYGTEAQEGFKEILHSILLNESVFMPIHHTIIPMEWNGKMMYSELWVDPDAEDEEREKRGKGEHRIQFLFKLDIQSLGFLELTLGAQKDIVDLDVYGPDVLQKHGAMIAEDLKTILESHGFKGKHVQVDKREKPLTLTEVFPTLFEGKKSVNVKI